VSIASRLRENASTSLVAAAVVKDPAFKASLDQHLALLTEAADALDKARDLLMRAYKPDENGPTNGWFIGVEKLFPEAFPKAFSGEQAVGRVRGKS